MTTSITVSSNTHNLVSKRTTSFASKMVGAMALFVGQEQLAQAMTTKPEKISKQTVINNSNCLILIEKLGNSNTYNNTVKNEAYPECNNKGTICTAIPDNAGFEIKASYYKSNDANAQPVFSGIAIPVGGTQDVPATPYYPGMSFDDGMVHFSLSNPSGEIKAGRGALSNATFYATNVFEKNYEYYDHATKEFAFHSTPKITRYLYITHYEAGNPCAKRKTPGSFK